MTKQAEGTINNEKIIIKIEQDTSAESPREWDNQGTMVCFHDRYKLGDEHNYEGYDEFLVELADESRDTKTAKKILSEKADEAYVYTLGQNQEKQYILIPQYVVEDHESDMVSTIEEAQELYLDKKATCFKEEFERQSEDFKGIISPEESKRMTDEILAKVDSHYDYQIIAIGTQFIVLDMNETEILNNEEFESEEEARERLVAHKEEWMDSMDMGDLSDEELMTIIEEKHVILPLYLYDHGGITMNTGGFSCRWDSGQVGWIYASKESLIDNNSGYSEEALFQMSIQGTPKEQEWVKVKGHENKGDVTQGFGYVVSIRDGIAQVDFDYTKYKTFKKAENLVEVPVSDITAIKANRAVELLTSEVDTYDQYLTGDIYGFKVEKVTTCECCGHEETEEIDSCWNFYGDNPFENGMTEHIDEIYHPLLKELE